MTIMNKIPYWVSDIPLVGGTIYHAGRLLDIWATPCSPSLVIGVEAFFAYAPTLIWGIFAPGKRDAITDGIGGFHRIKRNGRFKVKEINQKPILQNAGITKVEWTFLEWTGRIGWYLIIADATVDFLINWTSMMYVLSGCDVPGTGYAQLYNHDSHQQSVGFGPGWTLITPYQDAQHAGGYFASTPALTVPPNTPTSFSFGLTATGGAGDIAGVRIRNNDGFVPVQLGPNDRQSDGSWQGHYTSWYGLPNGYTWTMEANKTVNLTTITNPYLSAYGSTKVGLTPMEDWAPPFFKVSGW